MIPWIILAVLGWLACAAGDYLLIRFGFRKNLEPWTIGLRIRVLFFSALCGPFALLCEIILILWVLKDNNKPARW